MRRQRGERVLIRGPSVGDPTVEDDFPFTPPTPSQGFAQELLAVMGPERNRVVARPEEREIVPGQTAAVRFTRGEKWICIIRKGPQLQDIGFVSDISPHTFMPGKFLSLEGVDRFVLDQLLGTDP